MPVNHDEYHRIHCRLRSLTAAWCRGEVPCYKLLEAFGEAEDRLIAMGVRVSEADDEDEEDEQGPGCEREPEDGTDWQRLAQRLESLLAEARARYEELAAHYQDLQKERDALRARVKASELAAADHLKLILNLRDEVLSLRGQTNHVAPRRPC